MKTITLIITCATVLITASPSHAVGGFAKQRFLMEEQVSLDLEESNKYVLLKLNPPKNQDSQTIAKYNLKNILSGRENFYVQALRKSGRIIAADYQNKSLAVVYELRDRVSATRISNKEWAKEISLIKNKYGRPLLLQIFEKNEKNQWQIKLTAYLDTIWPDLNGERVRNIHLANADTCDIEYYGQIDTQDHNTPLRKMSINTVRRIEYGKNHGLNTVIASDEKERKKPYYTKDSVWWKNALYFNKENKASYLEWNRKEKMQSDIEFIELKPYKIIEQHLH